jgi:hypothetical protein
MAADSRFERMCNKFTFVSGDSDEFQIPPLLKPANRYPNLRFPNLNLFLK